MGTAERARGAMTRALAHSGQTRRARPSPAPPQIVLQPIVSISTGAVLAVEALARFADGDTAERFAIGPRRRAQRRARGAVPAARRCSSRAELPVGVLLSVNISPNALHHIASMGIWPADLTGVIVEVTEQDVDSPVDMAGHLADLRERGAAIAIDDVSSGYAGLLRLAQLRPDYVKIDRQVVSGRR